MTKAEIKRFQLEERAKLELGFGDDEEPCWKCGCRVSRKVGDRYECWWHYTGPLQLELT